MAKWSGVPAVLQTMAETRFPERAPAKPKESAAFGLVTL